MIKTLFQSTEENKCQGLEHQAVQKTARYGRALDNREQNNTSRFPTFAPPCYYDL
jgi:hypothetical protein